MKKIVRLCLFGILLIPSMVFADEGDRTAEHVINRVWNATDNTLKATISGTAGLSTLTADVVKLYGSGQLVDYTVISNDGTNSFYKWTDGYLMLKTEEGTNTDTTVYADGKGTGAAELYLRDGDDVATRYSRLRQGTSTFLLTYGSNVTEFAINEDSANVDLRVESDSNAHMFFVDGGVNAVGVVSGTWVDGSFGGDFNVVEGNGSPTQYLDCYDNVLTSTAQLIFRKSENDTIGTLTATANTDVLGSLIFQGVNSSSTRAYGAFITATQSGTAGATNIPTQLVLYTYQASGANTDQFVLQSDGNIAGANTSVAKQHDEIGMLLDNLTAPKAIVGFTGTGATTTTEAGYENGAGRTWTYSGGLTTDKIFKGSTYVYSFDGVDSYLSTPDTDDMSFGDGSNDVAFSMGGWVEVVAGANAQFIITKGTGATREWYLALLDSEVLRFLQGDQSVPVTPYRQTDAPLSAGWHYVVATQSGTGGATAMNTVILYVDGVAVASTATNDANYVAMDPLTGTVTIGATPTPDTFFTGDMGRLFVTAEALSAATVWKLYEKTRGFYNK